MVNSTKGNVFLLNLDMVDWFDSQNSTSDGRCVQVAPIFRTVIDIALRC